MATTTVKVALRIRPMTAKELLSHCSSCLNYLTGTNQIVVGGEGSMQKSFTFDYIFDRMSAQDTIYSDCVLPLVDRLMEGFNATVLAYGQVRTCY